MASKQSSLRRAGYMSYDAGPWSPAVWDQSGRVSHNNDDDDLFELAEAEEADAGLFERGHLLGVVPAVLHLADVRAAEHVLAQATLADAAADGLGNGAVEAHFVPHEVLALRHLHDVELLQKHLKRQAHDHM
eukprot:6213851-Pleurochrysis_carterae.AAC.4